MAMPGAAFAQQAAQAETMAYAIPAGSLAGSLAAFARTSGVRIAYSAELARGKAAPALNGRFTRADALSRILAGSGLSYGFSGANTVTISGPGAPSTGGAASADGSTVLDTITVTSGGGVAPADVPYSSAGSAAYLSAEQVDQRRGTSPGDLFSGIPGVMSGETRNSGAVDVNIRGLQGQGRVPVVVDGASQEVSVYRGYNGSQSRSYVDPDFIGGVAIEKGPSAEGDATGATGGVVRMSTITAKDILLPGETFGVRLKGGFASNSSPVPALGTSTGLGGVGSAALDRPAAMFPTAGNGSVAIAKTSEYVDVVAAYARRETGNYHAGTNGYDPSLSRYLPGAEVLNTSTDNESWMLKGNFRLDGGHSLELGYTKYLSEYGEIMPTQLSLFGGAPYQGYLNTIDLDTYTARYRWNPEDNDFFDVKFDNFLTKMDLRINSSVNSPGYPIGLIDYYAGQTRWGSTLSNTARFDTDFGQFSWNHGVSYSRENVGLPDGYEFASAGTPGLTPAPRMGHREELSAFTGVEWKPADWLTLSPSVRYSRFSSLDRAPKLSGTGGLIFGTPYENEAGGWSPLGTVKIEPLEGLQLYTKVGSALRSPSIFESLTSLSFTVLPSANPIRPERNRSMEFGVNYMVDDAFTAGDSLKFHAAYFDNHVKDYITRTEGTGGLKRVNLDHADIRGFEVSGEYDTGKYFGGVSWNHYTYTMFCAPEGMMTAGQSTCAPGGIYNSFALQQVPPKDTVTVNLGGRFLDDTLTLGGRMTYVGARMVEGLGDGTTETGYAKIRSGVWNPYALFDLYATYKPNESLQMRFSVDNVADRYYTDALNASLMPAPGRTFRFDLTIKPSVEGVYTGSAPLFPGMAFAGAESDGGARFDWTGFFAGVNSGLDRSGVKGTTSALSGVPSALAANESADLNLSGVSFGLQAGYNHQFSNGLVAGFEADVSRPNAAGHQITYTSESASYQPGTVQAITDYQYDVSASARARLGYAFDRLMVYGSGGLTLLREQQTRDQYISLGSSASLLSGTGTEFYFSEKAKANRLGATLGAGIEYALTDRWSIKADYNYTRFNTEAITFDDAREGVVKPVTERVRCGRPTSPPECPAGATGFQNVSSSGTAANAEGRKVENTLQFHSVKIGLNYRF